MPCLRVNELKLNGAVEEYESYLAWAMVNLLIEDSSNVIKKYRKASKDFNECIAAMDNIHVLHTFARTLALEMGLKKGIIDEFDNITDDSIELLIKLRKEKQKQNDASSAKPAQEGRVLIESGCSPHRHKSSSLARKR